MIEERKRYQSFMQNELGFRPQTFMKYLYYYDKFGGVDNLNEFYIRDFLLDKWRNNVARAFVKNYMEFVETFISEFPSADIQKLRLIKLPKAKKKENKLPSYINEAQMMKMRDSMKNERDRILLMLSFYCGLRLNEVMGLQPLDFRWAEWNNDLIKPGVLKIRSDIAKRGKEREVFVPPKLMERVRNYILWLYEEGKIKEQNEKLFPISLRRWEYIVTTKSKKMLGFEIHPHTLRHSFATMMRAKGVGIETLSKFLGHENIVTTQIYTHISQKELEKDYQNIMKTFFIAE